ncbi:hypothetical protein [Magnetococcus sp. PR-3]|uniref:hypothetical protein n=1 Tax=Magnetococcus sp. PR-3 TaxID=3120355 RepID=UPI002FCE3602
MTLTHRTKTLAVAASLLALTATVTPTKDAHAWFMNGPWNNMNTPWNGINSPWNGWGGPWNGPGYGYPGYRYGYPGHGYGYTPYAAYPRYNYAPVMPFYPNFGVNAPSQRFSAADVAQLKGKLGVRPNQESAWNALVEAAKGVAPNASLLKDPAVNKAYEGLMAVLDPRQQAMAENFKRSLLY